MKVAGHRNDVLEVVYRTRAKPSYVRIRLSYNMVPVHELACSASYSLEGAEGLISLKRLLPKLSYKGRCKSQRQGGRSIVTVVGRDARAGEISPYTNRSRDHS